MAEFKYDNFTEKDKARIEGAYLSVATFIKALQGSYYYTGKCWHRFDDKEAEK